MRPLNHPFLAVVLLCAVVIVAMWHFMPEGMRRLLAQAGVGVLAVAVAVAGTVSADTLIALTRDGRQWQVRFDLVSMRPVGPMLDRCGSAPGYSD